MMLEFVVMYLELCVISMLLCIYPTSSSAVISNYSKPETLIQLSYSYIESATLENSKIYRFKLNGNKINPENFFGKFIEKINISINIRNKTFETAEKLSNGKLESITDSHKSHTNQTIGFDFRSDYEFESLELKIEATLDEAEDAGKKRLEHLSIVWTKGTGKDVGSYCGKPVCKNVENLFEKWLMNGDVFDSLSIKIKQTTNDFTVANKTLDNLSDVKLAVYLSEPVCNFEETCSWTSNSKDLIRWETNVDNTLYKEKTLPNTNIQGDISGLLHIPINENHYSAKLTSPVVLGSGTACHLSFRRVVRNNVGFIVRIITSHTEYTVHVYKNPRNNIEKKWLTEDFFLGTINEVFRVELELFVLDMKVSYIAIDDIMLSNSSYIPGGLQACNDDEFQCSTGLCIKRDSTCNAQIDCLYREDESQNQCGLHKNFSCDFEGPENCTLIDTITSDRRYGVISANTTEKESYHINFIRPFMMLDHTHKSETGKLMFFEIGKSGFNKYEVKVKTKDLPALPQKIIMNKTCKIHFSYYCFDNNHLTIQSQLIQNGTKVYEHGETYKNQKEWKTMTFAAQNLSSTSYHWEFLFKHFHAHLYLDDIYLSPECYEHGNIVTPIDMTNNVTPETATTQLIPEPVIAVSIIIFVMVMFAVIFYVYKRGFTRCRRRKRKHLVVADKNNQGHLTCILESSEMLLRLNNVMAERNPEYDWSNTRTLNEIINSIPRSKLHIISLIGRGQFGEVHKATLLPRSITGKPIHVAIKKLPINSSDQAKADFFLEAVTLSKFKHPNIVDCIGIATDQNMLLLVLEYMNGGDLKCFLRESRPSQDTTGTLTTAELTSLAIDIAKGCWYLQQNKFVHRDIAARNCLVLCSGVSRVAKIADFGLARDVVMSDYYRKFGAAMVPVRWMPPESILEGYFSAASDVWSFGVLMWEIYSYGYLPYPGMSNAEVISFITNGGRLSQTTNCPVEIYRLMTECWDQLCSERPSFKKVLSRLEEIRKSMVILPISAERLEVMFSRQRLNTYDCPEGSPLIANTSVCVADDETEKLSDGNGEHK